MGKQTTLVRELASTKQINQAYLFLFPTCINFVFDNNMMYEEDTVCLSWKYLPKSNG